MILKINKILFNWYYKRVPKHFHSWTFIKSVKLLINNYEFRGNRIDDQQELMAGVIKRETELRKELENIRMSMLAKGIEIEHFNNIFGTDYKKPEEN